MQFSKAVSQTRAMPSLPPEMNPFKQCTCISHFTCLQPANLLGRSNGEYWPVVPLYHPQQLPVLPHVDATRSRPSQTRLPIWHPLRTEHGLDSGNTAENTTFANQSSSCKHVIIGNILFSNNKVWYERKTHHWSPRTWCASVRLIRAGIGWTGWICSRTNGPKCRWIHTVIV